MSAEITISVRHTFSKTYKAVQSTLKQTLYLTVINESSWSAYSLLFPSSAIFIVHVPALLRRDIAKFLQLAVISWGVLYEDMLSAASMAPFFLPNIRNAITDRRAPWRGRKTWDYMCHILFHIYILRWFRRNDIAWKCAAPSTMLMSGTLDMAIYQPVLHVLSLSSRRLLSSFLFAFEILLQAAKSFFLFTNELAKSLSASNGSPLFKEVAEILHKAFQISCENFRAFASSRRHEPRLSSTIVEALLSYFTEYKIKAPRCA